ncbi:MAG: molybdopterin-dependent oxidoreductase, partial [Mycobacterium sp.]
MAQTADHPPFVGKEAPPRPSGLVGVAAAAVALGVAQLTAVAFGPQADSRTAIGSTVIDLTPGPVKEWAIQLFGTSDKLFLTVVILVVIGVIAALTAQYETRRIPLGSIAIALAGLAGCAAVLSRSGASAVDVLPTLIGTVCGVLVLRFLVSGRITDPKAAETPTNQQAPDPGRRLSLVTIGFIGAGVLAGVAGVVLNRLSSSVSGDR